MEVQVEVEVAGLAKLLKASLDADVGVRRAAEGALADLRGEAGFYFALFGVLGSADDEACRLAAALYFKNSVKQHWHDTHEQTKQSVLEVLVRVLCEAPARVQPVLVDAIDQIDKKEYYWGSLLSDLAKNLQQHQHTPQTVHALLQTAHLVFKRWRKLDDPDDDACKAPVLRGIGEFGLPFLQKFAVIYDTLVHEINNQNKEAADMALKQFSLGIKIYTSFCWNFLDPFFKETLQVFFPAFLGVLKIQHHQLWDPNGSPDHPTLLEDVKLDVLEVVALFAEKYLHEWTYFPQFIETILGYLASTTNESRRPGADFLVTKALRVIATAVQKPSLATLFGNNDTLQSLVHMVVVPNLGFWDTDMEMLEDEPVLFVKRMFDSEYFDSSRSHAASELVQAILVFFEMQGIAICVDAVNKLLGVEGDTQESQVARCTAYALYTCFTARSRQHSNTVIEVRQHPGLIPTAQDFFAQHLFDKIRTPSTSECILEVLSAMLFLTEFRIFVASDLEKQSALVALVNGHLKKTNPAVYTSAAITLEKLLTTTRKNTFGAEVKQVAENLISLLQGATEDPKTLQNQDQLVRTLLRCVHCVPNAIDPGVVISLCIQLLKVTSSNPFNPIFTHYVFECLALTLRQQVSQNLGNYTTLCETLIAPVLYDIIRAGVSEYQPYAIQVFAQMVGHFSLTSSDSNTLPQVFLQMFELARTCDFWDAVQGNTPALALFLCACVRASSRWRAPRHTFLEQVLAVFERLSVSENHGNAAIAVEVLLPSIIIYVPETSNAKYAGLVLRLVLNRLAALSSDTRRTTSTKIAQRYAQSVLVALGYWFALQDLALSGSIATLLVELLGPGNLATLMNVHLIPALKAASARSKAHLPVLSKNTLKACLIGFAKFLASPTVQQHVVDATLLKEMAKAVVACSCTSKTANPVSQSIRLRKRNTSNRNQNQNNTKGNDGKEEEDDDENVFALCDRVGNSNAIESEDIEMQVTEASFTRLLAVRVADIDVAPHVTDPVEFVTRALHHHLL